VPQELSIAGMLESPMIADPLHRLDCCMNTDGAGGRSVIADEFRCCINAIRAGEGFGLDAVVTPSQTRPLPDAVLRRAHPVLDDGARIWWLTNATSVEHPPSGQMMDGDIGFRPRLILAVTPEAAGV
jgi:acetyl-CoA acetyltransferase